MPRNSATQRNWWVCINLAAKMRILVIGWESWFGLTTVKEGLHGWHPKSNDNESIFWLLTTEIKQTTNQPTPSEPNRMFHFRVMLSLRCWCLRAGDSEDVEGSWTWGRKGWDWKLPWFGARFWRFCTFTVYSLPSYHLTRPGTSVQRVGLADLAALGTGIPACCIMYRPMI